MNKIESIIESYWICGFAIDSVQQLIINDYGIEIDAVLINELFTKWDAQLNEYLKSN